MKKTVNFEKNNNEHAYSYYSKVLQKPFDSIEELVAAEGEHFEKLKAKEDAAAQKKNDAMKVEQAFKELNTARKEYKENLSQLTTEYTESLTNLKKAYDLGRKDIHDKLASFEEAYDKALKEFTAKHKEGYHLTLRDGDFETTISGSTTATGNAKPGAYAGEPKTDRIFDIFDLLFGF